MIIVLVVYIYQEDASLGVVFLFLLQSGDCFFFTVEVFESVCVCVCK